MLHPSSNKHQFMSEMLIAYLVMLSILLVLFYLGCVPIDCHGLDCEYVLSLAFFSNMQESYVSLY
jgi:hypothetical protein